MPKKKFCLFLIFFCFYINLSSNLNKYDFSFPIIEGVNLNILKKFNLEYPKFNEIKLNFFGKCGEILKYGKKNNKRDLLMFAYKSKKNKKYLKHSLMTYIILDSIKRNIPNAKVVCFIPENSNIDFVIKILKKNKVLIIKEKDLVNMNIHFFDRVIHADLTDIFFFSDIFKTLKPRELIMNKECGRNSIFGDKGNFILKQKTDIKWFNQSFGDDKRIVKIFKKINPMVINGGLIMGDSKEYLKFLDIMVKNFNYTKAVNYGYDQILINVLYYTGKLNKINIKFDLCTQRSCFLPKLIFNKKTKKFYYKDGCSPVLIHKYYPKN